MVRKPTLILLIILGLLIVLVFYLQKNPLPSAASQTPSAAAPAQMIEGLNSSNITSIELIEEGGASVVVSKDTQGTWMVGENEKQAADIAKAEQARSELAGMRALAVLPESSPLADIGLDTPTYTINLRTTQSEQITVQVGKKTSIGNGYYVQVDNQAPIVVNNIAIETLVSLMNEIIAPPATEAVPQLEPLVLPTTGP